MARARAACVVVVCALGAGCTLVSGAADLQTDPGASPDLPDRIDPDVRAGDGGGGDAGDSASNDGPPVDAGSDAGPNRLRTITFESGMVVGPDGVDSVTGQANVTALTPLSGARSLLVQSGSAHAAFGPADEVFVTFLFQLADPGANGILASLRTESDTTALAIDVIDGTRLRARAGGNGIGSSPTASPGTDVYRLGIHLRRGSGNAVAEVFVTPAGKPFPASPFATSNGLTLQRIAAIDLGTPSSVGIGTSIVFDDVVVDRVSMP